MKDLSLLAKLLAEEDIHVVHKQQSTAMFDVLNRELSLPIWKDMPKNIQDLFTLHEVGHALWTPLEMMTKIKEQKISHSVCNVLEDVRIKKAVQLKYKGAVKIFNNGYQELITSNFFETLDKDISITILLIELIFTINIIVMLHFLMKKWSGLRKPIKQLLQMM